jgi:hypothetical protein
MNHWNEKIKRKDLCHKHKIKTTMFMDDGSETSDQCRLAGVMLPPPLCTILCDYQQSKVVDQIEKKKPTLLLLLLLLNFLTNLMKQR